MIYNKKIDSDSYISLQLDTDNYGKDARLIILLTKLKYIIDRLLEVLLKRALINFDYVNDDTIDSQSLILPIYKALLYTMQPIYFDAYAISGSWLLGVATSDDYTQIYNGVTWLTKDGLNYWSLGGGDTSSNTHSEYLFDLDVLYLLFGLNLFSSIDNGVLIKLRLIEGLSSIGIFSIYSNDSNTQIAPYIRQYINDYLYNTGSTLFTLIDLYDIDITNFNGHYSIELVAKLKCFLIPPYILNTPSSTSWRRENNIFDEDNLYICYKIRDVTNLSPFTVIPYNSVYTRLSCDDSGVYFNLDFSQFFTNRLYLLSFMIVSGTLKRKSRFTFKFKTY